MENWKQKPLSQVVSRWIRGTILKPVQGLIIIRKLLDRKAFRGQEWEI